MMRRARLVVEIAAPVLAFAGVYALALALLARWTG